MLKTTQIVAALALVAAPALQAQRGAPPARNGSLPYVSPDGSRIAFTANRTGVPGNLYVIGVDGTGEKLVVPGVGGAAQWMPGGKRLYYETGGMQAETLKVFTVAADGSDKPQALTTLVNARGAEVAPDGKWIVASAGKMQPGRMPSIKLTVYGVDASKARELTDGTTMAFDARWSPDGKLITFAQMDSTRNMQMWLVNADGTGKRKLTSFTDADGHPQWPSWSPDGKKIVVQAGVYGQDPATNRAHIWIVDVATGAATKLAAHDKAYLDETPSFFPDGKRVAFQSDRTGRMEIWVMNVDGTGARQVTR